MNFLKKMYLVSFCIIVSCTENEKDCTRLSCLPNPAVNIAVSNTGKSVIETTGGIDGIVIYQYGSTVKAYDFHDPNKCTTDSNSKLTLSNDRLFLISDDGEYFLLQTGLPSRGISCRSLLQYNVGKNGLILNVNN